MELPSWLKIEKLVCKLNFSGWFKYENKKQNNITNNFNIQLVLPVRSDEIAQITNWGEVPTQKIIINKEVETELTTEEKLIVNKVNQIHRFNNSNYDFEISYKLALKHIKNKQGISYSYIYLVKNYWDKQKQQSRQKVIQYLGKAEGYEPYITQKVLERDGARCRICKRQDNLTIDHINPTSNGGKNDINNLQVLCERCNKKKGNK